MNIRFNRRGMLQLDTFHRELRDMRRFWERETVAWPLIHHLGMAKLWRKRSSPSPVTKNWKVSNWHLYCSLGTLPVTETDSCFTWVTQSLRKLLSHCHYDRMQSSGMQETGDWDCGVWSRGKSGEALWIGIVRTRRRALLWKHGKPLVVPLSMWKCLMFRLFRLGDVEN